MLAEIIPKIAGMDQEEQEYKPRPSSAGPERCIRSMVYHGLRIPRSPLPGRARLVLDDSSWHEELTADWIRKSAIFLHSQQLDISVDDPITGIHLKGNIDGIVTDLMGVDRLYEHKAINHFTFQRFWNGEIPMDYIVQTCIYINGAQELNPDISEGILLIKNKNTAQYMEYHIVYRDDTAIIDERVHSNGEICKMEVEIPNIVREAFDKFDQVKGYIDRQTLPKRQYEIDEWRCEYCGWYQTCWERYEKEFQELKTDIMLPDDVADMLRYYKEIGGQKSESEKEYKDLSRKIKDTMKQIGAREGRAGEYIVKLTLTKVNRIDKGKLTAAEIERATTPSMSERLYVTQRKEKNHV